jgi:uncharacterized protein (DUF849 family)
VHNITRPLRTAGAKLASALQRRHGPWVTRAAVYRYLDLSTAHTSPGELDAVIALTTSSAGPRTIRHEWGAWVNVPGTDDDEITLDALQERCPSVVACLRYARALDCQWINFDADAEVVDALPQFEW